MSQSRKPATVNENPSDPGYPTRVAAWYSVFVLMVCYTFSFVDRLVIAFLVTPLKHDLHLTDTQIGLLQGFAFAMFYSILGIPFGLAADRVNRRRLIVLGVTAWSLMTSLGCIARSFTTLILARMGVGVGEATLAPAAFSLIADSFPRDRLSSALSVYSMGVQVGAGLALVLGGLIVQTVTHMPPLDVPILGRMAAWQLTFLLVGAPGIFIALLVSTIREPPRSRASGNQLAPQNVGLSRAVVEIRLRWRSTLGICIILATQAMSNYAFSSWCPAFIERVHHWPKSQIGLFLGSLNIVVGCLGLICGGRLADHWLRRGAADAPLRVGLVGYVGVFMTLVPAMLAPSIGMTMTLLVPAVFCMSLPIGTLFASIQMIYPNEVRGTVSSMAIIVLNLVGLSVGALLPGLLCDKIFHSELMLGPAIAATVTLATFTGSAAVLVFRGAYCRDFRAATS